jgi:hypothetical protein
MGVICDQAWQRLRPVVRDTFAQHIPTIDTTTGEGDNQHIRCHCGDSFGLADDWLDHAIAETERATNGYS